MTSQQRNTTARREIAKELRNALANRLERGSVVTTAGKWAAFTVEYITWNLTTGPKAATKITICGREVWSVEDAASTALYEWGWTR